MCIKIMLIRHVESLKNTIDSSSSVDGKEPITKYGFCQLDNIVTKISVYFPASLTNTLVFCADDVRSRTTANAIAQALKCEYRASPDLASFTSKQIGGLLRSDILCSDKKYAHDLSLYRAGLLSAYDVSWPNFDVVHYETRIKTFLDNNICNDKSVIIVAHKSSLTCIALTILKRFGKYPQNYYGYMDIPLGSGLLFQIEKTKIDYEIVDFHHKEKTNCTDVIVRDGHIQFPESACAVCFLHNQLLLVQQERNNKLVWELPGGKIEADETPIETALRELVEETGYRGNNGSMLFSTDLDLSISIHKSHLVQIDTPIKEKDGELRSRWFSETELRNMITGAKITHVQTILAFLSRFHLNGG